MHGVSEVYRPMSGGCARDGPASRRCACAPRGMTVERADVVVVGGGPAGLIAAREAATAGLDVLLVERDRAIGAPVRCGEGVGSRGLGEFISPDGASWVARRITRVIFWAPDGTEVRVAEGDVGYILDRSRFEPALA